MIDSDQTAWTQPDWLEQSHKWIHQELAKRSIKAVGPIKQHHIRPWSIVLLVPTDRGNIYFKATAEVLGFEPAVSQAISRWQPELIPEVLAIDAEQRWMLMVDGGQRLREAFRAGLAVDSWSQILAKYALLQQTLSTHVDEMFSFGVRDRLLPVLPGLYAVLLADYELLLIDRKGGITSSEYQRLLDSRPRVAEMCRQLAGFNIPASLHHNDLHDANIFVDEDRYLFYDWGDSSVSHPFFSLRTVFVSIENTFGFQEGHPIFEDLASDYLDAWRDYESKEDLLRAFEISRRLWSISSAVKYQTLQVHMESIRNDFADAVPGLLQEFLELNPDF
jgi:hypothetical protein